MTIEEFVTKHGITLSNLPTTINPNIQRPWNAHHYACILKMGGRVMHVSYSRGMHLSDCPTAELVLDSMALVAKHIDEAFVDNPDDPYAAWLEGFGPDCPYEFNRATYQTSMIEAMKLHSFLGLEIYWELINDVERLGF
jgi:hypothetical protein